MELLPCHLDLELFQTLCRHDEGVKNKVYDDATGLPIGPGTLVLGNPTIGVGRNVGPSGAGLRDSEIDALFANDANYYEAQAQTFDWYFGLDPIRATVVTTMIFNMGLRAFSGFHDTISCIEKRDWEGAAANMLASHWAVQVKDRATRLAEMMRLGVPIQR